LRKVWWDHISNDHDDELPEKLIRGKDITLCEEDVNNLFEWRIVFDESESDEEQDA